MNSKGGTENGAAGRGLAEIEATAVELAHGGGRILARNFGKALDVEYKGKGRAHPVTGVDKECQDYLRESVSASYPEHGFIGEEDSPENESEDPTPEFVWVVDPLDGTRNFLSSIPVFACSIGVLRHGVPVAGAVHIPWPGREEGVVLHASRDNGAFVGDEPARVFEADEPKGERPVTVPASFHGMFRFDRKASYRLGEVRITGSIAHELAMTATGAFEYALTGSPRLWDVAAGVVLVREAGGSVLAVQPGGGRGLFGGARLDWAPLESFGSKDGGEITYDALRKWSRPMVMGSPGIARYITSNLRRKSSLRSRLTRSLRLKR